MAQVMAAPSAMMTVQVPEGAPPGTMVQLTAPNGQPVQVQIPPGLGPGQQFTIAVPAAAPQMMMPAAPAGPVVLVDHLLVANCGKFPGQAFAGYAADDVMGAGARPAFASEVTFGMIMDNMGCCKNPYQGLEVPVYLSTIDAGNGKITDRNFEAARLHFDVVPACQCPCDNTPISGRVVKAGVAYPLVSHGGPSACPQCIADADMTVNSTTLKGTLYPCCAQPCCDTAFTRPVEGEPGAGMYRWVLGPCASGPGRDPVQPFRRMPCCFCPGGKPIGLQTYSMQLPAKNDVPPEVWFAAAIFESVVYPYHQQGDGGGGDGGGGGGGGSVRVEEMER